MIFVKKKKRHLREYASDNGAMLNICTICEIFMCGSRSSACGGLVGKLYNLVAVSFRCVIIFLCKTNHKKHLYIPASLDLSHLSCSETDPV